MFKVLGAWIKPKNHQIYMRNQLHMWSIRNGLAQKCRDQSVQVLHLKEMLHNQRSPHVNVLNEVQKVQLHNTWTCFI